MIVNINTFSDVSFTRTFIYRNAAGVIIDLTNSILRMHVRARAEEATVFLSLSSDDGVDSAILLTDAVGGKFTITIPYGVLLRLPTGIYVHSLVRTIRSGFGPPTAELVGREEIWRGTLTHAAGPTRWT